MPTEASKKLSSSVDGDNHEEVQAQSDFHKSHSDRDEANSVMLQAHTPTMADKKSAQPSEANLTARAAHKLEKLDGNSRG